jgi:hypothetical protein
MANIQPRLKRVDIKPGYNTDYIDRIAAAKKALGIRGKIKKKDKLKVIAKMATLWNGSDTPLENLSYCNGDSVMAGLDFIRD